MSEHDDSAEVERLAEIANDAYSGHWHEDLIESSDFDPEREMAAAWRKAARAVLADLREQGWKSLDELAGYVIVPFSEPEQGRAVVYGHPGGDPHCVYPDGACTCPEGPLLTCPDCGQIHEWDDDTKERES